MTAPTSIERPAFARLSRRLVVPAAPAEPLPPCVLGTARAGAAMDAET